MVDLLTMLVSFRLLVSLSKYIQLSRRAWPKTLHKLDEIRTILRRGPRGERVSSRDFQEFETSNLENVNVGFVFFGRLSIQYIRTHSSCQLHLGHYSILRHVS